MDKKTLYLILFAGILCLAGFISTGNTTTIDNPIKPETFSDLLTGIADQVGSLIAILGTIMIIISGILYLTSAGSPERISKAKTALIYAVAGIAIGLAAKGIIEIVKNVMNVR